MVAGVQSGTRKHRAPRRQGIEAGARLRIREKIVGVPGEAVGTITRVEPGVEVTWHAPDARYRWLGIGFTVGEGVTWRIEPSANGDTEVSARVWGTFAPGLLGNVTEWIFKRVLNGVPRDREHARTELQYLKRIIEEAAGQICGPVAGDTGSCPRGDVADFPVVHQCPVSARPQGRSPEVITAVPITGRAAGRGIIAERH